MLKHIVLDYSESDCHLPTVDLKLTTIEFVTDNNATFNNDQNLYRIVGK